MITGRKVKWFEEVDVTWGPRGYHHNMRDEEKAELDEMVLQGIIKKVDEPTDWVKQHCVCAQEQRQTPPMLRPQRSK